MPMARMNAKVDCGLILKLENINQSVESKTLKFRKYNF
jgi:hypothetical protein